MKKFWLNCLLATATVFALMWALSKLTKLEMFDAFDPIGQALSDFELTDYAFSRLREDPKVDDRIVLVNIGYLSRAGIAEQIRIISKYKPKVIGIDSFFYCEGGLRDSINCPAAFDELGNMMLSNAIQEAGNVVLVSKVHQTRKAYESGANVYDSMAYSDGIFQEYADSGFANLATEATYQEDVKICRSFVPAVDVKGKRELAFSVKLAMHFDSTSVDKLFKRDKEEELVNFRGNVEMQDVKSKIERGKDLATTQYPVMFPALDVHQVFAEDFEPDLIRDKIVVMGFLGSRFGDPAWNDKFFTPLNRKVAGRANPDMFGVVVHANIVSMILNGDYIDELEEWHKYLIAFIFCYFNIALFFYINAKYPVWFDSVSLVLQVVQIVLLMGLTIWVFYKSAFKLDLTITLAAIALSGPTMEFYDNVLYSLVRIWKNRRLTNQPEEVLTPDK
jgi:CHASE2 domain-containing sensor protein